MPHDAILTPAAPAPIGPYSQAIRVAPGAELLFLSGQIPLEPSSGALVSGGIEAETAQVLDNLDGVLRSAGHSWSDVCKVTIFLRDMSDFPRVNAVYAARVGSPAPARATVQVAGLPRGVGVEIEVISAKHP
ncbi:MAG: RidA family protein [Deltaproteobacteria bacterium]|nr:RidA family protein [Deltaproteobacteria bacterium]